MSLLSDEEWTRYLEYRGEIAVLSEAFTAEKKRIYGNNADFNYMTKKRRPFNPPADKREEYSAIEDKYIRDLDAVDEKYGFSRKFKNDADEIIMLLGQGSLLTPHFEKLPPMLQAKYRRIEGIEGNFETRYVKNTSGGARKGRSRKGCSRKARKARKTRSRR